VALAPFFCTRTVLTSDTAIIPVSIISSSRLGVLQQMGPVNLAGFAISFEPAEDRGSGDLQFAALGGNRFIERFTVVAIGFGDVDPQQLRSMAVWHWLPP